MATAQYKIIMEQIAANICSGKLLPGTQLPTIRAMMKTHRVALATSARVYSELEAIGLVTGEKGRGTFVRDTSLPRGLGLEQHAMHFGAADLTFNYPVLPGQVEMLRDGLRTIAASGDLDALLHSAPQGGRPHDRQSVAKHLRNRGIRVPGEQVLIVNGAQQGLAVTVMALLKPGDVLALDALTYPGMKTLAQMFRLYLEPLPQPEGHMCLDSLDKLCRRRPVRAVYTMPTMHNPLGSVMGEQDRIRLAELADLHGFLIIEDGAYAFLADPAPRPVFTHAPHRTVYVSGLSKSVASGLRFGFIAAHQDMIPALETSIRVTTWNTPSIIATLGCNWIESGAVDDLEDRKREDAQHRQKLARQALHDCSITAHPSSYYLWLEMPEGLRADLVASNLKQKGIFVTTASPFSAAVHVPHALRLAIGSIPYDTLERTLQIVRRAVVF